MSLTTALLLLPSLMAAPQLPLQSILPNKPIEDPAAWAWGRHPRDGFGYKAKVKFVVVAVLTAGPIDKAWS